VCRSAPALPPRHDRADAFEVSVFDPARRQPVVVLQTPFEGAR
jgi:hypothetical protein